MKNALILFLASILLISCVQGIQSEPKFIFAKYNVSEEHFKSAVKDVDSLNVETGYTLESNIFFKTSYKHITIAAFNSSKKDLSYVFMENQFEQISKKAHEQISNLKEFDVFRVEIFNNGKSIKTFEKYTQK